MFEAQVRAREEEQQRLQLLKGSDLLPPPQQQGGYGTPEQGVVGYQQGPASTVGGVYQEGAGAGGLYTYYQDPAQAGVYIRKSGTDEFLLLRSVEISGMLR